MSKTLLCQLGMHPIILPEVFLLAPNEFTEVHAISPENKKSEEDQKVCSNVAAIGRILPLISAKRLSSKRGIGYRKYGQHWHIYGLHQ